MSLSEERKRELDVEIHRDNFRDLLVEAVDYAITHEVDFHQVMNGIHRYGTMRALKRYGENPSGS